jgi:hypothetical protein
MAEQRGPFEKFVDSPYYSKSEQYGDVVTVSFSKYPPWQAMHYNAPPTSRKRKGSNKVIPRTSQTVLVNTTSGNTEILIQSSKENSMK